LTILIYYAIIIWWYSCTFRCNVGQ